MLTRKLVLILIGLLAFCGTLMAQRPTPTELSGQPYLLKKTWMVGGKGNWDFLRLDAQNGRLYVAHGPVVQVVDVGTGLPIGEISGFRDARAIALDDKGEFGFVTDSRLSVVYAFDRRSLQIVAMMPTAASPRAIAYEPLSGLLFVACGAPAAESQNKTKTGSNGRRVPVQAVNEQQPYTEPGSYTSLVVEQRVVSPNKSPFSAGFPSQRVSQARPVQASAITVIDAETWTPVANILVHGQAGFVHADGDGKVFVNIVNDDAVLRLNGPEIRKTLEEIVPTTSAFWGHEKNKLTALSEPQNSQLSTEDLKAIAGDMAPLDWTHSSAEPPATGELMRGFSLAGQCKGPQGLSSDAAHQRVFVACANNLMEVLDTLSGAVVAALPTGSGAGVIEYDAARDLVFVASGEGGGALTIIRRDVADTYNVIQSVPTCYRARVLAVNDSSGDVYLASDAGQERIDPMSARLTGLKESTFHILVVGP